MQQFIRFLSIISSTLFLLWLCWFIHDSHNKALELDRALQSVETSKGIPEEIKPRVELSKHDRACLVQSLYYEIRSGTSEAIKNVAYVIINRTNPEVREFPDTICEVVHQPKHFSYLNKAKPPKDWEHKVLSKEGADKQALMKIHQIIDEIVVEGTKHKDVLWYTTPQVKQVWMKRMKVKYSDGFHKFMAKKEQIAS